MLKLRGKIDSVRAVEGAAKALWACSVSKIAQTQLLEGNFLEIVGHLLPTSKTNILIPTVGILQRCFAQVKNITQVQGVILTIIQYTILYSENFESKWKRTAILLI